MEIYLRALELLKELLLTNSEPFWADWMQKDIDDWNSDKTTEHDLHAFGGAGSFNDINLSFGDASGIWRNALLGNLASISYAFAKTKKIEFSKSQCFQLDGSMCRNCRHGAIDGKAIERFLAAKFVPLHIKEFIDSDDYLKILNTESLLKNNEVNVLKEKLKSSVIESGIELEPFDLSWTYDCKKCQKSDKISFRWDVLSEDDAYILRESGDNLVI